MLVFYLIWLTTVVNIFAVGPVLGPVLLSRRCVDVCQRQWREVLTINNKYCLKRLALQ